MQPSKNLIIAGIIGIAAIVISVAIFKKSNSDSNAKVLVVTDFAILNGNWTGSYVYADDQSGVTYHWSFANCQKDSCTGICTENNTFDKRSEVKTLEADLVVSKSGDDIQIKKTYRKSTGYNHSITYLGHMVKSNKDLIEGDWASEKSRGTFSVIRD